MTYRSKGQPQYLNLFHFWKLHVYHFPHHFVYMRIIAMNCKKYLKIYLKSQWSHRFPGGFGSLEQSTEESGPRQLPRAQKPSHPSDVFHYLKVQFHPPISVQGKGTSILQHSRVKPIYLSVFF